MVMNLSSQWLAQQSAQQAELAEIGFGLATLGMESLSRVNSLNFKTAKSLLAHTGSNLSAFDSAEQAQAALLKAGEQGVGEVQSYVRETADLMSEIHQQAKALFEGQLGLVKTSTENLIKETHKVSPNTSEIVGTALRGWVDGTQSAFEQFTQMSAKINKMTGSSAALIGAWQAGNKPAKTRGSARAMA